MQRPAVWHQQSHIGIMQKLWLCLQICILSFFTTLFVKLWQHRSNFEKNAYKTENLLNIICLTLAKIQHSIRDALYKDLFPNTQKEKKTTEKCRTQSLQLMFCRVMIICMIVLLSTMFSITLFLIFHLLILRFFIKYHIRVHKIEINSCQ